MADQEAWLKRVAEWRASGKTSSEFCKDLGYRSSSLLFWSSRLKRLGSEKSLKPSKKIRMARVVQVTREALANTPSVVIEVGGARVLISRGADAATLVTVLETLGRATRGER